MAALGAKDIGESLIESEAQVHRAADDVADDPISSPMEKHREKEGTGEKCDCPLAEGSDPGTEEEGAVACQDAKKEDSEEVPKPQISNARIIALIQQSSNVSMNNKFLCFEKSSASHQKKAQQTISDLIKSAIKTNTGLITQKKMDRSQIIFRTSTSIPLDIQINQKKFANVWQSVHTPSKKNSLQSQAALPVQAKPQPKSFQKLVYKLSSQLFSITEDESLKNQIKQQQEQIKRAIESTSSQQQQATPKHEKKITLASFLSGNNSSFRKRCMRGNKQLTQITEKTDKWEESQPSQPERSPKQRSYIQP